MVRCSNEYHIARKPIDLQQQGIEDALNFSRFLAVFSFLADGVKLIEEKNALVHSSVLEKLLEPLRRLSQIAVDHPFVTHNEERHG